jgi:hypothetical protein
MDTELRDESSLASKADAAFQQAAYKVIQRAKQTGTPVIIWEDNRIREVPPEEMELRLRARHLEESKP